VLDKHITEIVSATARFERIAEDYIALSQSERNATRVIAGTRFARNEINLCIRAKLGLTENSHDFVLLDRKDQTVAHARSILSYEVGNLVMAETDYPSLGMKPGETAFVVERRESCIILERNDGTRMQWQPALATKLTSYLPVKRPLAVGDLVRVTVNDRTRRMVNGDLAHVSDIETGGKAVKLRFHDGRTVVLDGSRPLALDYGYCSTVHASQGQTCDRVLIEADAHSLTAGASTFYVAISRARYNAHIYTDDRELLPFAMDRKFEAEAALDVCHMDGHMPNTVSTPVAKQWDTCEL
jgi:hypothetical protein